MLLAWISKPMTAEGIMYADAKTAERCHHMQYKINSHPAANDERQKADVMLGERYILIRT